MSNFDKSFDEMLNLEISGPYNALHKNKGENGYTFMGIYEKANPNWKGWELIYKYLDIFQNINKASYECYNDIVLNEFVKEFYEKNFWDKLRLNEIINNRIADLIFKFAVNTGIKRAVIYTQQIIDTKQDGIIGNHTIKALNKIDEKYFEKEYKDKFANFYKSLVKINPNQYSHFLNGWLNRIKNS